MPERKPTVIAYARPAEPVLMGDLPPPGWRALAGAAWLAGVLAAGYVAGTWTYAQQQDVADRLGGGLTGQSWSVLWAAPTALAFPAFFGAAAAAVLYDWRRSRLAWVLVVPALAGCASLLALATDASRSGGWSYVTTVAATQCGLTYAGTWLGRPVARWLARRLVPPPWRAATVALWV